MATLPVFIGSGAALSGTATPTYAITTSAAAAAGCAILVKFLVYSSGVTVSSIGDGTNAYNTGISALTSNNFRVGIGYALTSAGLASGSTITITMSATPGAAVGHYGITAYKVAGGLAGLDVSATATQTAVTALSVGPTGATAQNVELAVGVFGVYQASGAAPGFTAGGAYTALTSVAASGAPFGDGLALYPEYLVTAATGAQTATGTLGANASNIGGVVAVFTYPPLFLGTRISQAVNRSARWHHHDTERPLLRRTSGLYVPRASEFLLGKSF